MVLAGDFNVVPTERDIYPSKSYAKNALVQPEPAPCSAGPRPGWVDAIRTLHPDQPMYTFWDYLRNRWPRDGAPPRSSAPEQEGGEALARCRCRSRRVHDRASDHAPAWIVLGDEMTRKRGPANRSGRK